MLFQACDSEDKLTVPMKEGNLSTDVANFYTDSM